jgi:hypothetical protein
MTDAELKELVASLAIAQQETDLQLKENARLQKETDHQLKETDRRLSKQLRELGKQIGGLGQKFGSFTEGLALPSMEKILRQRFRMTHVAPRVRVKKGRKNLELDVLAYSNTDVNKVFVVEVKSHLREEGLEQILQVLRVFFDFFPEHKDKTLHGILATVDAPENLLRKVREAGIYTAQIRDDNFLLTVPKSFKPTPFTARA